MRSLGRTPPGVRELKHDGKQRDVRQSGRTPPGVRELKPSYRVHERGGGRVAPLPGCVN